jgi:hypothetical protein
MTSAEAHRLLNAARDGADVSRVEIARALHATGDIDADQPLQLRTPAGAWEHHMLPPCVASVFDWRPAA